MKHEEYEDILKRLSRLERRDQRLRAERMVMLVVIGWLSATGPGLRLLSAVGPRLEASGDDVRAAAVHALAELGCLLKVQPVLDPRTVLEDEREALSDCAPSPGLAKPGAAAAPESAATATRPAPESAAKPDSQTPAMASALRSSRPAVAAGPRITAGKVSVDAHVPAHKPPATQPSPSAQAASLAAAGRSIGQDVEKALIQLPGNGSFRALAMADWLAPGMTVLRAQGPVAIPTEIPAAALKLAPPSLPSESPAQSVPQSPLASPAMPAALRALGYAQAADGSTQIVLMNGNALLVVDEGQDFLERFRVVSVGAEGVDIEDRLTNRTLHLSFGR
jgi:hypothetical protein